MINNCSITTEYFNIAGQSLGLDMGALTLKSTIQILKQVRDDTIKISPETIDVYKDITFCFYIMYVNEMPFMKFIDNTIQYRST